MKVLTHPAPLSVSSITTRNEDVEAMLEAIRDGDEAEIGHLFMLNHRAAGKEAVQSRIDAAAAAVIDYAAKERREWLAREQTAYRMRRWFDRNYQYIMLGIVVLGALAVWSIYP